MKKFLCVLAMLMLLARTASAMSPAAAAITADADGSGTVARLPVKEITVFKDGHALVVHEGKLPTDSAGNVVMDTLPNPVMGTFWPYAAQPGATLKGVSAGKQRVNVERTALSVREMIEGNPGAEVIVTLKPTEKAEGKTISGTIVGVPERSAKELESTNPPGSPPALAQKSDCLLLKTGEGTTMIPLAQIADVTFKNNPKPKVSSEEFRNLLTLHLNWSGTIYGAQANVGLAYLQKGIRWIPNYKVELDGKGKATIKLQATLINEMIDLKDVKTFLVIGVPTVAFKETADPIGLQQTLTQLSSAFRNPDMNYNGGFLASNYSNAIQSQVVRAGRMSEAAQPQGEAMNLGPDIPEGTRAEDLFIFTVEHVTLKKGECMVLPVAEFTLKYEDLYKLDIPVAPPAEVMRNFNNDQQAQIARLIAAPKVKHMIRLANASAYPLTTAPALIMQGGRILAQAMMTYTAPGANSDLEVGTAVDVAVKQEDREVRRTPNAVHWEGNDFARIELEGTIKLTNYRKEPLTVEVSRYVYGMAQSADSAGKTEMMDVLGDPTGAQAYEGPIWYGWYSWPYWWGHFNGRGRFSWKPALESGKATELKYTWQYYWR